MCRTDGKENKILDKIRVESEREQTAGRSGATLPDNRAGQEISRDVLIRSLNGFIRFILGSVDDTPHSPTRGGFNLFYDMDALTYRVPHWMWSWGPAIKLLLDADKHRRALGLTADTDLSAVAERAGRASMHYLNRDHNHPASGLITVRWNTRTDTERGFQQYLSPADTSFLAGWGWIPLYEATGDRLFLEGSVLASEACKRLVGEFGIPPMDFIEDDQQWKNFTLNEAGFTPEGLAEVFRVTGDESVRQTAVDLMDNLMGVFESPEGLWYRYFYQDTRTISPDLDYGRGLGWAMEGLLAMNRMVPDSIYIHKAKRMAETLLRYQQPEGCWAEQMHRPVSELGITEKGTAVWSLLFYALHDRTHDERHLDAARKALAWCVRNQEQGGDPHAFGGVMGQGLGSGVVFRRWFRLICLFTCAFAGLSILEELKYRGDIP